MVTLSIGLPLDKPGVYSGLPHMPLLRDCLRRRALTGEMYSSVIGNEQLRTLGLVAAVLQETSDGHPE
jgi:hypothetical protein